MKTLIQPRLLLILSFLILNFTNLISQDAFSGTYKGDYNGVELPNPIVINAASNGVYNLEIQGVQHRGQANGNQITGISSAFTVVKNGNKLTLTESGVSISLTKIGGAAATNNSNVSSQNTAATTGKVDPNLVGVWVNDVTSSRSGFSHSTVKKLFIEANGQVKEGSRVIGGSDVGSFDSGLKIDYTGVISAKNGVLYVHELNGKNVGNVQGGTYRFVDKYMILKNAAGVETTYVRGR
jgi:hypothetical protein